MQALKSGAITEKYARQTVSIPFTNLECDKCGFQGGNGVVYGDFRYVDGDSEILLERTLGWCSDCQGFVAVEQFDDREEVAAKIEKIQDEVRIGKNKRPSFSLFNKRPKQPLDRRDQLPGLFRRLALIEKRKGQEKCLHCGSVNVSQFDGDYSQVDPFASEQETIHTGYFHPGCGGEILATASTMRFFIKYQPKFYSVDGYRIEGERHPSSD